MIELRTLGALDLRGPDGEELRPVLSQPKRVALLAYLAAATPRTFHSRDTLLALFWPELDTEHARGALRNALYFLRRELDDRVLLARGDEIGLDFEALWCDAAAFEATLDAGEEERALALYRGEFLEGFHVSDAPEFERWLERKRTRLSARASEAAWALAAKAEARGNAVGAAGWARRASALAPYDEAGCRQLIGLLGRLGDRSGAIREYELFARRLAQDYDLEPSPDTRALVETIRGSTELAAEPPPSPEAAASGRTARRDGAPPGEGDGTPPVETAPPSSAEPVAREATRRGRRFVPAGVALLLILGGGLALWRLRSVPAPPPASASRITVFPFSYRGDEALAYLGEGMVDLLSANLDGAGELRTVDPHAVLGQVAQAGGDVSHREHAQSVAERLDAGLYVIGSVVEAAGQLRISARLYASDGREGNPALATVEGEPMRLFQLVDDLTAQLLAEQRKGPEERLARLAARTTESLPALKAYLEGEREYRAGRWPSAVEALQHAVEADSSFALAYYRLSVAADWGERHALARDALDRAARHSGRLRELDRWLIEAWSAFKGGEHARAERLYREIIGQSLNNFDAWYGLGETLLHRGMFLGRSWAEARDAFEHSLRLAPHQPALIHLAQIAARQRDRADLDPLTDIWLKVSPSHRSYIRALRGIVYGDTSEVARFALQIQRASAPLALVGAGTLAWFTGNLRVGRRLLRLLTDPARSTGYRALAHKTLAELEALAGRWSAARTELDALQELDRAAGLEHRALLALTRFLPVPRAQLVEVRDSLLAWDGAAASDHGDGDLAKHGPAHPFLRQYLLGLLSARLGDERAALGYAEELERRASSFHVPAFVSDLGRSVRTEVARVQGRPREALEILEEAQLWEELMLNFNNSQFFAHAYERFARAELLYELGRYEEARRWYVALADELYYQGAFAHFRLGEIYERLGGPQRAAEHYARFIELWKHCDPESRPLVETAERRLGRLRVTE